jgi:hypothetical protein
MLVDGRSLLIQTFSALGIPSIQKYQKNWRRIPEKPLTPTGNLNAENQANNEH